MKILRTCGRGVDTFSGIVRHRSTFYVSPRRLIRCRRTANTTPTCWCSCPAILFPGHLDIIRGDQSFVSNIDKWWGSLSSISLDQWKGGGGEGEEGNRGVDLKVRTWNRKDKLPKLNQSNTYRWSPVQYFRTVWAEHWTESDCKRGTCKRVLFISQDKRRI